MTAVLAASGISKSFAGIAALDDVSIEVAEGERVVSVTRLAEDEQEREGEAS